MFFLLTKLVVLIEGLELDLGFVFPERFISQNHMSHISFFPRNEIGQIKCIFFSPFSPASFWLDISLLPDAICFSLLVFLWTFQFSKLKNITSHITPLRLCDQLVILQVWLDLAATIWDTKLGRLLRVELVWFSQSFTSFKIWVQMKVNYFTFGTN